ncbi:NAD(P)H-binding protein [Pedobacter sp. HMF7647]|uniref:NAD(P)H-binding protein n=1 Tax=Hufsiella arboris TaxID=2695275 RepID=A0A7K1Y5U7_9SPHI|nr:NAD(P)H-binding protein [Hufsiella arboris]MXV49781.1 NAD(P)H-binding protein [Hufsiella arboris]
MTKTAIIVGATGLIGSQLLKQLVASDDFAQIILFARRDIGCLSAKTTQHIIDFDHIQDYSSFIKGDVLFSCLGSTNSKTPDKALYKKVDLDYTLSIAEIAKQNGVEDFHVISSIGADAHSSNFYLKLKGEIEDRVKKISFKSTHIYQPSLLLGKRPEFRVGERLAQVLMPLMSVFLIGSLRKYKPIKAEAVAAAMINQSLKNLKGVFIYPSNEIQKLA